MLDPRLGAAGVKQRLGPFKDSSVMHRLAVLSKAHRLKKAAHPCRRRGEQSRGAAARGAAQPNSNDERGGPPLS